MTNEHCYATDRQVNPEAQSPADVICECTSEQWSYDLQYVVSIGKAEHSQIGRAQSPRITEATSKTILSDPT